MHMEFPHNILKQKKKMGCPLFLVRGDVENITYPVSQRGLLFFRYHSPLAWSLSGSSGRRPGGPQAARAGEAEQLPQGPGGEELTQPGHIPMG